MEAPPEWICRSSENCRREGREQKERDHEQNHEIDVEQQQDAAVVKAPSLLQAAGRIPGGGAGYKQRCDEPEADVDLGKAGEGEADPECAESQCGSAKERFLLQPEDGKARPHRPLLYGNAVGAEHSKAKRGCDSDPKAGGGLVLLTLDFPNRAKK
jgi:hypothetical protein